MNFIHLFSLASHREGSIRAFALVLLAALAAPAPSAYAVNVLQVPRDFNTIQEAVDNAEPGDIIQVKPGVYGENLLITTPDIRLRGRRATLDGAALDGIGIHVMDTSGVEISGFVVQSFEAGIVLEGASYTRVHRNTLRENTSETATLRDGIQLIDAHWNLVTNNSAHDVSTLFRTQSYAAL